MRIIRYILFPFSVLYWGITSLRNFLFEKNVLKEFKFDTPVINVGNLTVGGTGKTPFVEYLIRRLKNKKKIAVLSRGYGRKTKGFFLADDTATAEKIGDEPMQYFTKYGNEVTVAVGEDRVQSIPRIFGEREDTDLIILDDAYQHRYVKPSFNILLTKYKNLFFKDFVMPTGNLRESRKGARRADVVIVTKCPQSLDEDEKIQIKNVITHYAGEKLICFTSITYGALLPVFDANALDIKEVFLFSGIANDTELRDYVAQKYEVKDVVTYPDHYKYTHENLKKLLARYQEKTKGAMLLTTEKDMVKLLPFKEELKGLPLYYLPIEITFTEGEEAFNTLLNEKVY